MGQLFLCYQLIQNVIILHEFLDLSIHSEYYV